MSVGHRDPAVPVDLPRLLVLTDRHQSAAPLDDVVAAAVAGGARAVVLREKDLPAAARADLAARLAPLLHAAGGVLLAAGGPLPGADGVHQPASGRATRVAGVTGRSCHDAAELRSAVADGVHYVTLSPLRTTASKPGYGPPLGVRGLAALAASTTVPVYALGGITSPSVVAECRRAGAHGVAVMGAVMRSRCPERTVAELLAGAEER